MVQSGWPVHFLRSSLAEASTAVSWAAPPPRRRVTEPCTAAPASRARPPSAAPCTGHSGRQAWAGDAQAQPEVAGGSVPAGCRKLAAARKVPNLPANLLLRSALVSCAHCVGSNGLGPLCCLAARLASLQDRAIAEKRRVELLACSAGHAACCWESAVVARQGIAGWQARGAAHLAGKHAAVKHEALQWMQRAGYFPQACKRAVQMAHQQMPRYAGKRSCQAPLSCLSLVNLSPASRLPPTWFFSHSPAAAHRPQRSSAGPGAAW